jgi:hypothetical protein
MSLIITIEDLESLLKEKDSETANALRNFIYNYKKEIADEEEKEQLTIEHFKSLGIPESALYSEVRDDINCQRLEFGLDKFSYSGKSEWYLDCGAELWLSEPTNLLEVLMAIEKETGQQIVRFGLNNGPFYATKENQGRVHFDKIKGEVYLSECMDTFNLKLADGRYFHLYFCESK